MSALQFSMIALIIAYAIVWFMMPAFLPVLHRLKFGQEIREEGPKSHLKKAGTPTMGGIVMIVALVFSVLISGLWCRQVDWYLLTMLLYYGLIGFIDDYIKVTKKHNEGLTVIQKLVLQIFGALLFTVWAYSHPVIGTDLLVPFVGMVNFGYWYLPVTFIAIVAVTNAVNLADGLDGLCSGVSSIVMLFFLTASLSYGDPATPVFAGAFIGACLAFLRYNSNPADVFMGDTGSMALGGGLIGIAIMTHLQIYFLIAGFIFVLEALSVVIQVGYFKLSHGKRVFRMAPIHHHFELGGWKETRVVSVFYSWTALCVAVAYLLL